MRKSMMCMAAMPMMPMMAMAAWMRSAASCGSRWKPMGTDPWAEKPGRRSWSACADEDSHAAGGTVVDTARKAGTFSSLLGALKAAGLDSALEGAGPFTVFAPNDEAFRKVPKEMLDGLLSRPEELAKVLKFHVVSGRLTSAELASVSSLRTLDGRELRLDLSRSGKVGEAHVVQADIACANGVIHVVDSVLLPS